MVKTLPWCSLLWNIHRNHSFLYLQSTPCYECVITHLTISIWKDVWNSFQFFTVTSSAIEGTYVFPENMLLDVKLLVKRVGHSKLLTVPNYWTKKKLCLQWSRQKPAITSLCQHRISSVLKSASLVCVICWYLWVLIFPSLIIREVEDLFICILTVFLFSIKYMHRIQNTPSFSMIFAFRFDWNSPEGSQTLPRK